MQDKTSELDKNSRKIGLQIHPEKTKILKARSSTNSPINIRGKTVEEVETFTYLGSKVSSSGDSEVEVEARLSKARYMFANLNKVWKSTKFSTQTKI